MQKLISKVTSYSDGQMFITTHNNMITSRLGLNNLLILNKNGLRAKLSELNTTTSKFFIKSPNNNILNFILSSKIILVEGHAEYILMEKFIDDILGKEKLNETQIISVNGLSFKRYLEIADLLKIKTAVITDNDKNYAKNVTEKYKDYKDKLNIKIFAPTNNELYTFEKTIYDSNKDLCLKLFGKDESNIETYMLSNKTECAYTLLTAAEGNTNTINIPDYIKEAIEWINA